MDIVNSIFENGLLTICLSGHVDSTNAAEVESAVFAAAEPCMQAEWVVDADKLEYLSSAGLRVILKLKKANRSLRVINVCPEVYDVFEMTGFTEMMDISKAYRQVSVEGCDIIGSGSNGLVYRLDPDTIIKVYRNPNALPEIHNERELARKAFVMGIPTAISYDVVRVGESYGSVFELLNAKSIVKILQQEPERLDEMMKLYVDLMKTMHSTEITDGSLPRERDVVIGWVKFLREHIPAEQYEKLLSMVEAIPEQPTMLHGDLHVKNIMVQNGEVLLIDMDTLCTGHPVMELASMYLAYRGFGLADHTAIERFMGISYEMGGEIWDKAVRGYFAGETEEEIARRIDMAMTIGLVRLLRRTIRREPENTALITACREKLTELIARTDKLYY